MSPLSTKNALEAAGETDYTSNSSETFQSPSEDGIQDTNDNVDIKRLIKTKVKTNTAKPPASPNITTLDKTEHTELDKEDGWSIAGKKITPKETKKPTATVTTPPIRKGYAPKEQGANPVAAAGQRYPQHQGRPS
jgi:hypothetical protein